MNDNQEIQDSIVYFSTVFTNFLYVLIIGMLYLYADLSIAGFGGIVFGIGISLSIISMTYIALQAIKLDSDRSKTIIKLAIFHIPALIGLITIFVTGFVGI